MQGLLELEDAILTADPWEAEVAWTAEPSSKPSAPDDDADHLAWAFIHAVRDDDLGLVDGIDVRARFKTIVRTLAKGPARSEVIDEIAILRDACRWSRQWTSTDVDWPM
jgi:hypothetical protein